MASGCIHHAPVVQATPIALRWTPFYWAMAGNGSVRFQRAAILLEVQLMDGQPPSVVQLDLAASGEMPDGFPVVTASRDPIRRTGELHGVLSGVTAVSMRRGSGAAENLATREIGVFGLPNYERQGLIIDVRGERLGTFAPPADLQAAFGPAATVVAIDFTGNQVIVPILAGPSDTVRALFDTGLSPFPLWTTFAVWKKLTGRDGPGAGTTSYRLAGRSGPMRFVGAALTVPVRLGNRALPVSEAVYLVDGPPGSALENWPDRLDAVIEPAALTASDWIILDIPHRRLGLAKPLRP